METLFQMPETLTDALGQMLLHAIWQATLIAVILFFVLKKIKTAKARYFAATISLLLISGISIGTFWMSWEIARLRNLQGFVNVGKANTIYTISEPVSALEFSPSSAILEQKLTIQSLKNNASNWLENHRSDLINLWLLGFGLFLFRLLGGLYLLQNLRRKAIYSIDNEWFTIFEKLAARVHFSKKLKIGFSENIESPAVFGYVKPVLLLPFALINQLSTEEVEAVLAHELGHLVRRDWLVSLAQSFIETVFYYHPAVWWISGIVRTECENACDDFAIELTQNRLIYAKTLLKIQELKIKNEESKLPAPALAFAGTRRYLLLDRIKRVLNQQQSKSSVMEKITLSGILLALLSIVAFKAESAPKILNNLKNATLEKLHLSGDEETQTAHYQVFQDSIPKGKRSKSMQKITRNDDNQKVEMTLENGQITTLIIDDKEIPKSDFGKYEDLTAEMMEEMVSPAPPSPPAPPSAPYPAPPPAPPAPPSGIIRSEKDKDGNTVILLEKGGEPVEIKVKNGEVYVNGDKIEEGEEVALPGIDSDGFMYWNDDEGNRFEMHDGQMRFFENGELAHHFNFNNMDFPAIAPEEWTRYSEDWENHSEDARAALKEEMARLGEELSRLDEALNVDGAEIAEELGQLGEELARLRENVNINGIELEQQAQEQMRQAEREMRQAKEDMRRQQRRNYARERHVENPSDVLIDHLIADGILKNREDVNVKFTRKQLKVNGKKQSAETLARYLELYEGWNGGKEMGKDDKIEVQIQR